MDRLDFSHKDLTGADLSCRTLSYADFTGTNLTRANLRSAILNVVTLDNATLTGADLRGASVTQDVLCCPGVVDANFEGAIFKRFTIPAKAPIPDQSSAIASYLATQLTYDPRTGRISGADVKYKVNKAGANMVVFDNTSFYADRLAWTLYHGRPPAAELEHVNGYPADDRVANLVDSKRVRATSSHLSRKQNHPNILSSERSHRVCVMMGYNLLTLGCFAQHEWALKALECAKRNLFMEDLIGE